MRQPLWLHPQDMRTWATNAMAIGKKETAKAFGCFMDATRSLETCFGGLPITDLSIGAIGLVIEPPCVRGARTMGLGGNMAQVAPGPSDATVRTHIL